MDHRLIFFFFLAYPEFTKKFVTKQPLLKRHNNLHQAQGHGGRDVIFAQIRTFEKWIDPTIKTNPLLTSSEFEERYFVFEVNGTSVLAVGAIVGGNDDDDGG